MKHPNCLDLDPQGGDIELLEGLERQFGFKPTQGKVGDWLTLGDVHATLLAEADVRREGVCPSMRAFYRLRTVLIEGGLAREALRPEALLDDLAGDRPTRFLSMLRKQSGLKMPSGRFAPMGKIGGVAAYVGFIGSFVLALNGELPAAMWLLSPIVLGVALVMVDKGRWPVGMTTLGDLADRVAALNHHQMGNVRDLPDTLWSRLTAIIAEQCEMAPHEMRADMLLFAPRKSPK